MISRRLNSALCAWLSCCARSGASAPEENAATVQQLLDEQSAQLGRVEDERNALHRERDEVRSRVERLLGQLNDLE